MHFGQVCIGQILQRVLYFGHRLALGNCRNSLGTNPVNRWWPVVGMEIQLNNQFTDFV